MPRRRFAIARRCPPSHRTRPTPPATAPRTTRLSPILEIACESHLRYRSARAVAPSIGSRYAAHTRSPRIPGVPPSACGRRRVGVGTCASHIVPAAAESAVLLAPKTHPRLPMTQALPSPSAPPSRAPARTEGQCTPLFTDKLLELGKACQMELNRIAE